MFRYSILILGVAAFLLATSTYALMNRWQLVKVHEGPAAPILYRLDRWTGEAIQIVDGKSYEVMTPLETAKAHVELLKPQSN